MAVTLDEAERIDPHEGQWDLSARQLRFCALSHAMSAGMCRFAEGMDWGLQQFQFDLRVA